MKDTRKTDRRKKNKKISAENRKGPRRLVCACGGMINPVIAKNKNEKFVCLRCGKTGKTL